MKRFFCILLVFLALSCTALADEENSYTVEANTRLFRLGDFSAPYYILGQGVEVQDYTWEAGLINLLVPVMKSSLDVVNISSLNIPCADENTWNTLRPQLQEVITKVLNSNPEFFCYNNGFDVSTYNSCLSSITLHYSFDNYTTLIAEYEAAVERALSECIEEGMTAEEKALALHSYIALHCYYDHEAFEASKVDLAQARFDYPHAWDPYGTLVLGESVCQGYAMAYMDLMNRAGVETILVPSDALGHIWNLVNLGTSAAPQRYHVDVTWDDMDDGYYMQVIRESFLCIDMIIKHIPAA